MPKCATTTEEENGNGMHILNEILSIKHAIYKAMCHSRNKNNKNGHMKYVIVDMPLSLQNFKSNFGSKFLSLSSKPNYLVKTTLTIQDLIPIFGQNWNRVISSNYSTQQRIIGSISLQYRSKNLLIPGNENCPRYYNM